MDLRERVARAMEARAAQPVANLESLEGVLVGSLGDVWDVLADAAIAEMQRADDEVMDAFVAPTVTRDGPVTAIHDLSLPVDPGGILAEMRSWRSEEGATDAPQPPAVSAFLRAIHTAGIPIATEADGSRWVSVDELWRLERAGFVVVPSHATCQGSRGFWKP